MEALKKMTIDQLEDAADWYAQNWKEPGAFAIAKAIYDEIESRKEKSNGSNNIADAVARRETQALDAGVKAGIARKTDTAYEEVIPVSGNIDAIEYLLNRALNPQYKEARR